MLGQRARWWCWWLSNCPCWDCISRRCSNSRRRQSAPDDHFAAGPDCRVNGLGRRARWWCWWPSNCRCRDCISRRCSNSCAAIVHPRRSFHCRSTLPCDSIGQRARWWCWWPSNCPWRDCISRRCSKARVAVIRPRRSFHCRSRLPCERIGAAGALVVLVAVQLSVPGLYLPPVFKVRRVPLASAPDDHFAAGPDCRVSYSGSGRVGGAGGRPTIGAGIVSPAGVQVGWLSLYPPQMIISLPVHTAV